MLVRLWQHRIRRDLTRDLILTVLLGIAVSPISWWHHYTLALLPFLYLWSRMPYTSDPTADRPLLLLFLAVGTNLVGFALTQTTTPAIQLALAAATPALTLAIVCRELTPDPTEQRALIRPETGAEPLAPPDLRRIKRRSEPVLLSSTKCV